MLKIWNAANFRRTLTAICLIGAPLLFSAAEFVSPPGAETNSSEAMLAQVAQYRTDQLLLVVFGTLSAILFIPLVFGLIHMLSDRGVVLGHIGGGLTLLGSALIISLDGMNLALWAMTAPGMDLSAMAKVLDGMGNSPIMMVLFMSHWIFAIGILLLGIALWQARICPRWASLCIILAPLIDFILGSVLGDGLVISVLSDALFIIGFGGIAWKLLVTSDAEWEQMAAKEAPQPIHKNTVIEAI